jgi:hypothetical protein
VIACRLWRMAWFTEDVQVAALEKEDLLLDAAASVICDRDQLRRRRMQQGRTVWVKPWLLR